MTKKKEATNPFFVVLLIVGMTFFVSATAYGVMAFKAVRSGPAALNVEQPSQFLVFMEEHGNQLLGWQLLVLAIATFGAIGSDDYWARRAQRERKVATAEQPERATGTLEESA